MTDFLHRLADRVTAAAPVVRPRLPALFEPASAGPAGDRADDPAGIAAISGPGPAAGSATWSGAHSAPPDELADAAGEAGGDGPSWTRAGPAAGPAVRFAESEDVAAAGQADHRSASSREGGGIPGATASGSPGSPLPSARSDGAALPSAVIPPDRVRQSNGPALASGTGSSDGAPGRADSAPSAAPDGPSEPGQDIRPEPAQAGEPRPTFRLAARRTPASQDTDPPARHPIATRSGGEQHPPARAGHPPPAAPDGPPEPGQNVLPEPAQAGEPRPTFRPAARRTPVGQDTDPPAADWIATRRVAPVPPVEPAVFPDRSGSADRLGSAGRSGSAGRRPAGPPALPAPTISVTIGRVEVRAAAAPSPSPAPRPTIHRPVPTALEDYLRQRARGSAP